jgi:hypothetical protein
VKTYIEEFLTTFSGFHQTFFSFLTAYSLQQLFLQLLAHSNFFHSHSPTKQTLRSAYTTAVALLLVTTITDSENSDTIHFVAVEFRLSTSFFFSIYAHSLFHQASLA